MENKLKMMFDYQRFEGNETLRRLISETESRYEAALTDEDLSFVSAAGDPHETNGNDLSLQQTRPVNKNGFSRK